ncbi:MAG: hypothetical protein V4489_09565 [Chlamydiota bacterium]
MNTPVNSDHIAKIDAMTTRLTTNNSRLTKEDIIFLRTITNAIKEGAGCVRLDESLKNLETQVEAYKTDSSFSTVTDKIIHFAREGTPWKERGLSPNQAAQGLITEALKENSASLNTPAKAFQRMAHNWIASEMSKGTLREENLPNLTNINSMQSSVEIFKELAIDLALDKNTILEKIVTDLPFDQALSILKEVNHLADFPTELADLSKASTPQQLFAIKKSLTQEGPNKALDLLKSIYPNLDYSTENALMNLFEGTADSIPLSKILLEHLTPESSTPLSNLLKSLFKNSKPFSTHLFNKINESTGSTKKSEYTTLLLTQNPETLQHLRKKDIIEIIQALREAKGNNELFQPYLDSLMLNPMGQIDRALAKDPSQKMSKAEFTEIVSNTRTLLNLNTLPPKTLSEIIKKLKGSKDKELSDNFLSKISSMLIEQIKDPKTEEKHSLAYTRILLDQKPKNLQKILSDDLISFIRKLPEEERKKPSDALIFNCLRKIETALLHKPISDITQLEASEILKDVSFLLKLDEIYPGLDSDKIPNILNSLLKSDQFNANAKEKFKTYITKMPENLALRIQKNLNEINTNSDNPHMLLRTAYDDLTYLKKYLETSKSSIPKNTLDTLIPEISFIETNIARKVKEELDKTIKTISKITCPTTDHPQLRLFLRQSVLAIGILEKSNQNIDFTSQKETIISKTIEQMNSDIPKKLPTPPAFLDNTLQYADILFNNQILAKFLPVSEEDLKKTTEAIAPLLLTKITNDIDKNNGPLTNTLKEIAILSKFSPTASTKIQTDINDIKNKLITSLTSSWSNTILAGSTSYEDLKIILLNYDLLSTETSFRDSLNTDVNKNNLSYIRKNGFPKLIKIIQENLTKANTPGSDPISLRKQAAEDTTFLLNNEHFKNSLSGKESDDLKNIIKKLQELTLPQNSKELFDASLIKPNSTINV